MAKKTSPASADLPFACRRYRLCPAVASEKTATVNVRGQAKRRCGKAVLTTSIWWPKRPSFEVKQHLDYGDVSIQTIPSFDDAAPFSPCVLRLREIRGASAADGCPIPPATIAAPEPNIETRQDNRKHRTCFEVETLRKTERYKTSRIPIHFERLVQRRKIMAGDSDFHYATPQHLDQAPRTTSRFG